MEAERELLEFNVPYVLAEVLPHRIDAGAEARRCTMCGSHSEALPADRLMVVKTVHPLQPRGRLVLYCETHFQAMGGRQARVARNTTASSEPRTGALCPHCFVTVPLSTGVCDLCGEAITR